ncbi:hypothetical protein C1H46_025374 [Malus baccata]|uniref:Major facilitator superfamily (MFS) profile domain-containing protein n=1 Tax=Malus baccata TaxID=106549 RepID=A0A540LRH0_MALBA|nr:hypothetical protein C1H46_025374 [Malus baccata]
MWGAVFVAIAAATGNLLQGWDNATIAGAVLYIKREFKASFRLARKTSNADNFISLHFLSGLVMLWAPNVYVLLLARLLDGFGIGLAVTLVPVYISETAPPEIRGLLNTLPQFTGSGGIFLSYCMVFGMSLNDAPSWRMMLGVLSIPSLVYFGLTLFYLPESPRWLVSKGRMDEAKKVLHRLGGREDVSGEMALLFEGLGIGGEASLEEYIIGPANEGGEGQEMTSDKDQIRLFYIFSTAVAGDLSQALSQPSLRRRRRPNPRRLLRLHHHDIPYELSLLGLDLPRHPPPHLREAPDSRPRSLQLRLLCLELRRLRSGDCRQSLQTSLESEEGDRKVGFFKLLEGQFDWKICHLAPDCPRGHRRQPRRQVFRSGQANLGLMSRQGSLLNPNVPYVDPLVNLFGSVHEKLLPENTGSMRNLLNLRNMGSILNMGSVLNVAPPGHQDKTENWDLEGNGNAADFEDNVRRPLLSGKKSASMVNDMMPSKSNSFFGMRHNSSLMMGTSGEAEGALESQRGSMLSVAGGPEMAQDSEYFQASALVSQPYLISKRNQLSQHLREGKIETQETVIEGSVWKDLLEPGVKRALFVGVAIQILQQFSDINGVLYYTPQILEQAGVVILLSDLGLSSTSSSFLISALTTLLMLPSIGIAMRLMDTSGRRSLLLTTLPVLTGTLLVLIFGQLVHLGSVVNATISTISVVVYFCTFVMGFGPIPNILCSEIFPTWVRGLCIAICALTFWIGDIIVTYTLPIMLTSIGLAGVFAIYAVVCTVSWVFVFLKVPETKGMPLEVISEFFSVGAKQAGIDEKLT